MSRKYKFGDNDKIYFVSFAVTNWIDLPTKGQAGPVRAGLCEVPEDYHYSSARFYVDGTNDFGMLKHFSN